jgi:hypothetical protein
VTIATALITALVGIIGTVAAATLSNNNSERQFRSETDRSTAQFLREQRLVAYTAFANEANNTYQAVLLDNLSFPPAGPVPSLDEFTRLSDDVLSHTAKMVSAGLNLELLASDEVCEAAIREENALSTAVDRHVNAAEPYAKGKPIDAAYRKISMTDENGTALGKPFQDFTRAAREDLNEPALRAPAKNCPH